MDSAAKIQLKGLLEKHEGFRTYLYTDTRGFGTIGYGRNLVTRGVSPIEAAIMLDNDIEYFLGKLDAFEWFTKLDWVRQIALVDMCFNLGYNGLLEFKLMIAALNAGNWTLAFSECMNSEWAKQVKSRAVDIADILLTGELHG